MYNVLDLMDTQFFESGVTLMRGRPKKNDNREKQYRVRLNETENQKLNYVCESTGLSKSDVMRHALEDFFAKVEWGDYDEEECEMMEFDHISLKRAIRCPYCKAKNRMDLGEDWEITSSERQMGAETMYEFDLEVECDSCGKQFQVSGYICEYPVGAFNDENIEVTPLEDKDEDEDEDEDD